MIEKGYFNKHMVVQKCGFVLPNKEVIRLLQHILL